MAELNSKLEATFKKIQDHLDAVDSLLEELPTAIESWGEEQYEGGYADGQEAEAEERDPGTEDDEEEDEEAK